MSLTAGPHGKEPHGQRRPRRRQCSLPLGALERYDETYGGGAGGGGTYGIRTLAVSYDPVTRCLLRAVRCRTLLGDDTRVAVQAVALEWEEEEKEEEAGTVNEAETAKDAGAGTAKETRSADVGKGEAGQEAGEAVRVGAAAAAAAGCRYVDAASCAVPRWVCWLSVDGRPPPPPPPPHAEAHDAAEDPAAGRRRAMSPVQAQQLEALADLLPAVMCAAGGRLYLPAGPRGQSLAVWDLAAALAAAPPATAPPPEAAAEAADAASGGGDLRSPHCWLTTDGEEAGEGEGEAAAAHPGRLLAAAADGSLAVSGCDGGVLRVWHGGARRLLGSGDIRSLTLLPPVPLSPQTSGGRSARRQGVAELRGVGCEG